MALPQTPFEINNGAWSTLAQETDYLNALDAATDRIQVIQIGTTAGGRPLRLVIAGPPRTKAEIKEKTTILMVCMQHGDEPAGRDAALIHMRDHAASTSTRTILYIPNANPDGFALEQRGNSFGTDINRDHLDMSTIEIRAMRTVIRDYDPKATGDYHEANRTARVVMYTTSSGGHPEGGQATALSIALRDNYIKPALSAAGYTHKEYDVPGDSTSNQQTFNAQARLQSRPLLLIETARSSTFTLQERMNAHLISMRAQVRWLNDNIDLRNKITTYRNNEITKGSTTDYTFQLVGTVGDSSEPVVNVNPAPGGFRISDTQMGTVKRTLDIHGIEYVADGTNWIVWMNQRLRPIIPLLLDSRANLNMISATVLNTTGPTRTLLPLPGLDPDEIAPVGEVGVLGRVPTRVAEYTASGAGETVWAYDRPTAETSAITETGTSPASQAILVGALVFLRPIGQPRIAPSPVVQTGMWDKSVTFDWATPASGFTSGDKWYIYVGGVKVIELPNATRTYTYKSANLINGTPISVQIAYGSSVSVSEKSAATLVTPGVPGATKQPTTQSEFWGTLG